MSTLDPRPESRVLISGEKFEVTLLFYQEGLRIPPNISGDKGARVAEVLLGPIHITFGEDGRVADGQAQPLYRKKCVHLVVDDVIIMRQQLIDLGFSPTEIERSPWEPGILFFVRDPNGLEFCIQTDPQNFQESEQSV